MKENIKMINNHELNYQEQLNMISRFKELEMQKATILESIFYSSEVIIPTNVRSENTQEGQTNQGDENDTRKRLLKFGDFVDTPVAFTIDLLQIPYLNRIANFYMNLDDFIDNPGATSFEKEFEKLHPELFEAFEGWKSFSNIEEFFNDIDEKHNTFDEASPPDSETEKDYSYEFLLPPTGPPYQPYEIPPGLEESLPDSETEKGYAYEFLLPPTGPPYQPYEAPTSETVEEQSYSQPNFEINAMEVSRENFGYRNQFRNTNNLIDFEKSFETEQQVSRDLYKCCTAEETLAQPLEYTGKVLNYIGSILGQKVLAANSKASETRQLLSNELIAFMGRPRVTREERMASIPPRNTTINITNHITITKEVDMDQFLRKLNDGMSLAMASSAEGVYL